MGTVALLRRYPVKSMLGEDVERAEVTGAGIVGDRVSALVDRATGKVASAKNPRLWRGLLDLRAETVGAGEVRVTAPDGTVVHGRDEDVDAVLSRLVGREVTLAHTPPEEAELDRSTPEEVLSGGLDAETTADVLRIGEHAPGTFLDFAPLHLIATGTLAHIGALRGKGPVAAVRYRPNLVVETDGSGFVENEWLGRVLTVGDELVLRTVAATPRCALPTLDHGGTGRDTDALRVPARHNRFVPYRGWGPEPCVGVYTQVVREGRVSAGDVVRLR
ncbi:MOSC domain-containing protein [Streptomyces sp. NPDC057702]|uniref:MOSC domain-containing protein n=1 Tax=unclassified Streptomyces TaxID=2593676 RepID=UPI0036A245B4